MRILVTGSSGQLGAEITRQLAAVHQVMGLDLAPGPWTTHQGSVADVGAVRALAAQVDAIVHCASLHAPHVGTVPEDEFESTNVLGTRHLLEAARDHGHDRFVYTSTTSVYGDALVDPRQAVWVTEDLTPRPRDVYDRTKLAAEALCREASGPTLRVTCLRVGRLFPEPAHIVAAHRLCRGLDPRDAARAHVLALQRTGPAGSRTPPGGVFELCNVSARSPFLPEDLRALGQDAPAVIDRRCPGTRQAFEARGWPLPARIDRVHDITRAGEALGYLPEYGLASLLAGSRERWLYHLRPAGPTRDPYAPDSLALEGFVHCSYRAEVAESARLYFPAGADLEVLQIDPRRLGVAIEEAETPRGPMPHVFGPIRGDAVVRRLRIDQVGGAPDQVE